MSQEEMIKRMNELNDTAIKPNTGKIVVDLDTSPLQEAVQELAEQMAISFAKTFRTAGKGLLKLAAGLTNKEMEAMPHEHYEPELCEAADVEMVSYPLSTIQEIYAIRGRVVANDCPFDYDCKAVMCHECMINHVVEILEAGEVVDEDY